ncbi:hypothetical protein RRG08_012644 [Elysia crispata]|uniref:Uncharacterized protein n=1 Tax=Elysia crispata TaxID=231223 RepID=A0AAE0YMJ4_9GAST|nr:hypothetical protein RRG08_012644 [Elysia crispata]
MTVTRPWSVRVGICDGWLCRTSQTTGGSCLTSTRSGSNANLKRKLARHGSARAETRPAFCLLGFCSAVSSVTRCPHKTDEHGQIVRMRHYQHTGSNRNALCWRRRHHLRRPRQHHDNYKTPMHVQTRRRQEIPAAHAFGKNLFTSRDPFLPANCGALHSFHLCRIPPGINKSLSRSARRSQEDIAQALLS